MIPNATLGRRTTQILRIRFDLLKSSLIGFTILAIISWAYVLGGTDGIRDFLTAETWSNAAGFVHDLTGLRSDRTPAYADSEAWMNALRLSVDTLAMSVLAIAIAGIGVLLTVIHGARNVASGELDGRSSRVGYSIFHIIRGGYVVTRAVPELVWALLIVFVFSPGILAGALALALHNYGVLGKLSSEVVENMDTRPAKALRASGASRYQILVYAVIPQVLPQFMTYLLYRWEVVIRTTIVVGFVAAGGLGQEFRLRMSWFHFDHVALLLITYIALVLLVDILSALLRRLSR